MDALDGDAEAILVDDGSTDRTYELMQELAAADQRFKLVRLSRNFGHQIALTAGVDVSSGDAVIIIDADLQDPPEVVLELAAKWREGWDVVYAIRDMREGETWFKRKTATWFYRAFNRISEVKVPLDVGDFRLVDRRVLDVFERMRESNRFVRGMFSWIGLRQTGVLYKREERFAGETKYPLEEDAAIRDDGPDQLLTGAAAICTQDRLLRLVLRVRARRLEPDRQADGPLRGSGLDVDRPRRHDPRRHAADHARRHRRVRRRHPRGGEGPAAVRRRGAAELLRSPRVATAGGRGARRR